MEQILSQDEIDALLKGISEGEIETQKEDYELAEVAENTVQEKIGEGQIPRFSPVYKKQEGTASCA